MRTLPPAGLRARSNEGRSLPVYPGRPSESLRRDRRVWAGPTHLKLSCGRGGCARGEMPHKFSEREAKRSALFPRGTEKVAWGGARRHPRNAVPQNSPPRRGVAGDFRWSLASPRRDAAGTRLSGGVASLHRYFSGMPVASERAPRAGSSRFFRCVSPEGMGVFNSWGWRFFSCRNPRRVPGSSVRGAPVRGCRRTVCNRVL
jgi:hypothetical protein